MLQRSLIGTSLAAGALLSLGAACAWQDLRPQAEGAHRLYIDGDLPHVSDQAIAAAVRPHLGGGFFEIDIDAIRADVVAIPWIAEVAVRRQWPSGVVVRVREHRPAALWGDAAVVSEQGRVFTPPSAERPQGLPVLVGPEGTQSQLLERLPALQAQLQTTGHRIRRLQLDATGAWRATLDNGLELRLGREDIETRLHRFATLAVPHLQEQLETAAYVDLRYVDGFAVGGSRTDSESEGEHEQEA